MYRIDDPSAALVLPVPEASGREGFFTEGVPGVKDATLVRASFLNMIQEELRNIVLAANILPDKADYSQLLKALRSIGVFQTAAQFDNSTKVATTEFVKKTGVSHSAIFGFNAAATLSAAHIGGFIYTFGAGGFALKLPPIAGLSVGSSITYSNQGGISSNPVTITTQGGSTIQLNGGAVASAVVAAGDSLVFVVVGVNEWMAFGTGALAASASFAESIGNPGFKGLPGGFFLQFGAITATPGGARAAFRMAFPHQCLGAFLTVSNGNSPGSVSSDIPSITGFNAYAAAPTSANYFAIGN